VAFAPEGPGNVSFDVDNFEAPDSQFDNQCCGSNAYVPVTRFFWGSSRPIRSVLVAP